MQVTITVLPASLSLVHIPRSRLSQLSHPVLHQILQPSPTFLNITCNEIELSLFAEEHMLEDFEPIARRDRQRRRSRSGSNSSTRKNGPSESVEPVEITYEKWSVLQIDSHSDQMDNSGARAHELSAPLAAAGISILYQSSYMSDFIFVKEARLQEAVNLFSAAGFDLYSSDSGLLPSNTPPTSPLSDDRCSTKDFSGIPSALLPVPRAVLTRTKSSPDTSLYSMTQKTDPTAEPQPGSSVGTVKSGLSPTRSKAKSHSPTSGEVNVLSSDLTCVGLSDENVDHWSLKIVKLVAFPDLIVPPPQASPTNVYLSSSRSSINESHKPYASSDFFKPSRSSPPPSSIHSALSPSRSKSPTHSSSSSSYSSSDEEDGYFSHSPDRARSTSSLVTSNASRSYSDLTKLSHTQPLSPSTSSFKPPSKHLISTLTPLSPIIVPSSITPKRSTYHITETATVASPRSQSSSAHKVPFFSFTRTTEGSSLTADVTLLATLFPPSERYMVICGQELDAADERMARGDVGYPEDEAFDDADDMDSDSSQGSTLKCLQIDLRRFGLDKHGLVNRFSRVLEENSINHMYSSTFKTANLLVDKKHALRAQALLRAC